MPSYRIFETTPFRRTLDALPRAARTRIERKLHEDIYPRLAKQPHFGPLIRKLRDWKPATWRYRVGRWRFFYEIDEQERMVFMTAAAPRKDAYR